MKIFVLLVYFVNVMHVAAKNSELGFESYFNAKSSIFDLTIKISEYSILGTSPSFLLDMSSVGCIKSLIKTNFYLFKISHLNLKHLFFYTKK